MKEEELRRRLKELGSKANNKNKVKADLVTEYVEVMAEVTSISSNYFPIVKVKGEASKEVCN